MRSRILTSGLLSIVLALTACGCSAEADADADEETVQASDSALSKKDQWAVNEAVRSAIGYHVGSVLWPGRLVKHPVKLVGSRWSVNPLDYITQAVVSTLTGMVSGTWDFFVVDFTYEAYGRLQHGTAFFAKNTPGNSIVGLSTSGCPVVYLHYVRLFEEDDTWRPQFPFLGSGPGAEACH